ncbi:MAG: hypothetical protein WCP26_10090 [Actinomycetes bacterium]
MTALRLLPELEDALRSIPGVRAVSVVTGPNAEPIEVHVLATTAKPAKQIVRDVQSLAMASYGMALDHRIVSVVQLGDEPEVATIGTAAALTPAMAPRPSLTSITVHSRDGEVEISVALTIDGTVFTGTATGPGSPAHRARIVAEASLRAVDDLLGLPSHVDSAALIPCADRLVALVVLTLSIPRVGEQVMCGSALVRGDDEDAVARAVLAAINRRLAG